LVANPCIALQFLSCANLFWDCFSHEKSRIIDR
jgi:hypothetical protein